MRMTTGTEAGMPASALAVPSISRPEISRALPPSAR